MNAPRTDVRHAYEVNRERIARLWAESQPIALGDAADYYLRRNGLRPQAGERWPDALRMHPALEYWHSSAASSTADSAAGRLSGQGVCLGRFPALVAALEIDLYPHGLLARPQAHAVALQRIYLTPDGEPAAVPAFCKVTGTDGHARGAAVRIGPLRAADRHSDTLGVAVGLLPALRISRAARMPVWSVADAAALAHVRWPRRVSRLHVFIDATADAQHAAAAQLVRKATACGLEAFAHSVTTPDAARRASPNSTSLPGL